MTTRKNTAHMQIRRAQLADSKVIAQHLLLAMEDIVYNFLGEQSRDKAVELMEYLVERKGNQYSYDNCWVIEEKKKEKKKEKVLATALVYDGGKLHELRRPVADALRSLFDVVLNAEDETEEGEMYLDCIGVSPDQQGKGLGSMLLKHLIDEHVGRDGKTLGLLVDKDNPHAKKLYLNVGFKVVGEKTLTGKTLEHMQYSPADEWG